MEDYGKGVCRRVIELARKLSSRQHCLMKHGFFTFLFIISFSIVTRASSPAACADEEKRALESLSFVPGAMVIFHAATVTTSQVLWVGSTSRDKGAADSKDSDMTLYWLMPSLGFNLAALMSSPNCRSIVLKDGQILVEETERQIKIGTRIAAGMSLLGQFVSLTNTIDDEKRQITRSLMGATVLSQVLFEWLWSYRQAPPVATVLPYITPESQGLSLVYRF